MIDGREICGPLASLAFAGEVVLMDGRREIS